MHDHTDPPPDGRSAYERLGHDESPLFSRRSFLRTSAFALAGATMVACTGGGRKQPVVTPTATASVVATDTRWPIKRAIYVMMENRSFDNLYGRFPGANGATVGVKFGQEVPLTPSPHWLPGDIPHDRAAHLNDVNGGSYDGFGNGQFGDPWAYTQFEGTSIPNYWSWAKDYVLCDNFFASVGGPSYPNHFFFVAGQSGGALDNPENILTRQLQDGRTFKSWGCDAVGKDVFVLVKDEKGNLTKHDSCFTFRDRAAATGGRRAFPGPSTPRSPGNRGTSGTPSTASRASSTPTCGGPNGSARSTASRRTSAPAASPRSRGSRRGSSSRITRPRARASRTTGSPTSSTR